jgi:hypothetical protein
MRRWPGFADRSVRRTRRSYGVVDRKSGFSRDNPLAAECFAAQAAPTMDLGIKQGVGMNGT